MVLVILNQGLHSSARAAIPVRNLASLTKPLVGLKIC